MIGLLELTLIIGQHIYLLELNFAVVSKSLAIVIVEQCLTARVSNLLGCLGLEKSTPSLCASDHRSFVVGASSL